MPLAEDEDRCLDLEGEADRLERRGVMVLPEVSDQAVVAALVLSGSPLVASFGFASLKLLRTRVGAIGGGPGVTASVCGAPQPVSRS